MNLGRPDRSARLDALAAAYALGTLSFAARHRLAGQALRDPAISTAIRTWEWRLAALADGMTPVPPPPRVWERIQARLGLAGSEASGDVRPQRSGGWSSLALWRGLAVAGFALALALGISLLSPTGERPFESVVVVLAGPMRNRRSSRRPAVAASGVERVALRAPAGVALQGIPALAVSLEPAGGSTTGAPTGPVLYSGRIERTY